MELLKFLLEKHTKHEIAQIWNPSFWGAHLMKYFDSCLTTTTINGRAVHITY